MQQEKKDKTISAVTTFLIIVACAALCSWLGYKLPDPPIEEEGMGVAGEILGEIEGFGDNDNATFDNSSAPSNSYTAPAESYTTGNDQTNVAKPTKTNDTPKPTTPKEQPQQQNNTTTTPATTPEPATNPAASFPGRNKGTASEGKGTAIGSGQAGSTTGTQGGSGGSGQGNGSGYSLNGRSLRGSLPVPSYESSKDGDVTINIKVDRNGNVVDAQFSARGSKNYDNTMVKAAIEAAKKAHFNADPSATEYQYGTITYKFRRRG